MLTDDRWWPENSLRAGDELCEIFDESGNGARSYREAQRAARDVLLLLAPLLHVDPNFDERPAAREQLLANLVQVSSIARAIYEGELLDQSEINGARFVMTCLEPVGEAAIPVLRGCRYALAALALAYVSVVFDEMWLYPGPEAWCLAELAYSELMELGQVETSSESDFWVRPDDDVVSLAAAHRISDAIRDAGGGETMSNN